MPIKHIAVDPDGRVHSRTGKERVYSHCVAVLPNYAVAFANAQKVYAFYRQRYQFLRSVIDGTADMAHTTTLGSTDAIDARNEWFLGRAKAHLNGAKNYDEYASNLISENIRRVEALRVEGYYERWSITTWNALRDHAEKEAVARRMRQEFSDVVILNVKVELW